jgi:hypothetical protein
MPYLSFAEFKDRTVMPPTDVDALHAAYPTFFATRITSLSAHLDSRLRKRYAVPFADPTPEAVKAWLTALLTLDAYLRRGVNATDEQFVEIVKAADSTKLEIKEAADSETGLFDLPLRADTTETGIVQGSPFGYAEPDPYAWLDVQKELVRG